MSDDIVGQSREATTATEQRVLRWSLIATTALSAIGIVWGIAVSSHVIIFDGVYGLTGIVMTWFSMKASRLVATGPSARFPFGREALTPMVIAFQGLVLLGICIFAIVEAVLVIVDGGSDVSAGYATLYAVTTGVMVITTWFVIRRSAHHSELLAVEATQWLAASALSGAMIIGFAIAMLLDRNHAADAGRYADPILMLLAALALVPTPLRLMKTTVLELLEGAPPSVVAEQVQVVVTEVSEEFGLDCSHLRMSKLGRKLYVETVFIVDTSAWDLDGQDRVRSALLARVEPLRYDIWMTVELSGNPAYFE